jgi:hypothetical protein
MKPLGPNEGINVLRHPDCRFCDEYQRLMRGEAEKNRQLRQKLAKKVRAELYVEQDDGWGLAGSLGQAIADETGSCSLEFGTYEQVAEGIAKWIEGVEL